MPLNRAELREWLTNGLNPDPTNKANLKHLEKVQGFEVSPFGLVEPRLPSYVGTAIAPAFLEEQLIKHSGGVELEGGFTNYLEIADLGEGVVYLFDGTDAVLRQPDATDVMYADPGIATGCEHLGQVYMSGPLDVVSDMLDSIDVEITHSLDGSYIYYSCIGYDDLTLLFDSPTGASDDYVKLFERNELGWVQLKEVGEILQIVPLGADVIAYGTEAIYKVRAGATPFVQKLFDLGLANRGSVVDAGGKHIFLCENGALYELSEGGKKLGYENVFESLLSDVFILCFDPNTGNTFISSDSYAYLLSTSGLSRIATPISSIVVEGGVSKRTSPDSLSLSDLVQIADLDIGDRDIKTLRAAKISYIPKANPSLSFTVKARDKRESAYTSFTVSDIRDNGYQQIGTSGVDFDLTLNCSNIEYIANIELDIETNEALYTGDLT